MDAHSTPSGVPDPALKLTYDDFLLFPDDGKRHELIDGEHYVTPSPNTRPSSGGFTSSQEWPSIGSLIQISTCSGSTAALETGSSDRWSCRARRTTS